MMKGWIVLFVAVSAVAGWIVARDDGSYGAMDRLFDNHVTQARQDSQEREGMGGLPPMEIPPHTIASGIPGPGLTGETVFPRIGGGYLETGRRAGGFGDTVPVELTAGMSVRDLTLRGEMVYRRHCASCHGTDGLGKGPVASYRGYPSILPFNDHKFERYPLGKVFSSTAFGQGNMPAFGTSLSVDEIWQSALWVRHLYGANDSAGMMPNGEGGRS